MFYLFVGKDSLQGEPSEIIPETKKPEKAASKTPDESDQSRNLLESTGDRVHVDVALFQALVLDKCQEAINAFVLSLAKQNKVVEQHEALSQHVPWLGIQLNTMVTLAGLDIRKKFMKVLQSGVEPS